MADDPYAQLWGEGQAPNEDPGDPYADLWGAPRAPAVGTDTPTAMGQRGLRPDVNNDVLKTITSTPARFAAATLGLPGLAEQGAGWLAEKIGGPGQTTKQVFPTQEDIMLRMQNAVPRPEKKAPTTGWDTAKDWLLHDPRTTAGSVVGGTLDIGTSLLGVGGGPRTVALANSRTPAELGKAVQAGFDTLQNAGIRYAVDPFKQTVRGMERFVRTFSNDNRAVKLVNEISGDSKMMSAGRQPGSQFGPDFDQLQKYRSAANDIIYDKNATPDEIKAAVRVKSDLDFFEKNSPMSSPTMGQAYATRAAAETRDLARRNIKQREIGDIMTRAKNAVDERRDTVLNRSIDRILENKNLRRGWSEDELATLRKLRTGGLVGRFGDAFGIDFTQLGNLKGLASAVKGAVITGGATAGGEPMLGTALVGAGSLAKAFKPGIQRRIAKALQQEIIVGEGPQNTSSLLQLLLRSPIAAETADQTLGE